MDNLQQIQMNFDLIIHYTIETFTFMVEIPVYKMDERKKYVVQNMLDMLMNLQCTVGHNSTFLTENLIVRRRFEFYWNQVTNKLQSTTMEFSANTDIDLTPMHTNGQRIIDIAIEIINTLSTQDIKKTQDKNLLYRLLLRATALHCPLFHYSNISPIEQRSNLELKFGQIFFKLYELSTLYADMPFHTNSVHT